MKRYWKNTVLAAALAGMAATVPLLPAISGTARAQSVTIDGRNLHAPIAPIKRNGRTLVAMRPIFEGLGAQVQWDAPNKRITANTGATTVVMQIGNMMAFVDGRPVYLEQAPILYMGNTMVPLRFVSESLGAQVFYDAPTNNIGIVTGGQSGQNSPSFQQAPVNTGGLNSTVNGVSLNLAKRLYAPNEPIPLNFTAPTSLPGNAWAAILPADTPPGNPELDNSQYLSYQYLGGKARGTLNFKAPKEPGHYIFRVNQDKKQYSSIAFEVQPTTPDATPEIAIEKDVYAPGEPIDLYFEAFSFYPSNAWVGIVPADIEHGSEELNNKNYVSYQYLSGKTKGKLSFKAPKELGDYDFRLNNGYGHEIASIPFSVASATSGAAATMRIDKTQFAEGETIRLQFTAPSFFSGSAWIGLVPADIEHGSEELNNKNYVSYQYTGGKTQGTLTFKAPTKPGVYDFRFNDSHGNEVASTPPFTVGNLDDNQEEEMQEGDRRRDNQRRNQRGNQRNRNRGQQNDQYQDDQYQDQNAGQDDKQKGRVEDIIDDVADDATEATKESLKSRIRKKIFR